MDKVLAQKMGLWSFSCLWGTATGIWGEGKLRLGELEAPTGKVHGMAEVKP